MSSLLDIAVVQITAPFETVAVVGVPGQKGADGAPGSGAISWNETPAGTIDGANLTFTLANAPSPSSALVLSLRGLILRQGIGHDFTLSGLTITFADGLAPETGDWLIATYPYD